MQLAEGHQGELEVAIATAICSLAIVALFFVFLLFFFLIGRKLLYNVVLVFAIQQRELVIILYISTLPLEPPASPNSTPLLLSHFSRVRLCATP